MNSKAAKNTAVRAAHVRRGAGMRKKDKLKVAFTGLGGEFPIEISEMEDFPGICVSRMPQVGGLYHVPRGSYPPGFEVWLVNIFAHDSTVTILKEKFPKSKVIVQVDTLPEALHWTDATNLIKQIQAADLIGDGSEINARFYAGLTGKPYTVIPAPLGPMEWFESRRNETRAARFAETGKLTALDFVLAVDHFYNPGWCLPNIAALSAVQRETGLKVKYINASDITKKYAALAGLKCVFMPTLGFEDLLAEAMKAVLAVDMYASHSQGRHEAALAAIGLPTIGSTFTGSESCIKVDPFDACSAAREAKCLLGSKKVYLQSREEGFAKVHARRADDAVRKKVRQAVELVMSL